MLCCRARLVPNQAVRGFAPADVEAGRAYVAAYVDYVHFVERMYEAAEAPAHQHAAEHGAPASKASTAAPAASHGKHAH